MQEGGDQAAIVIESEDEEDEEDEADADSEEKAPVPANDSGSESESAAEESEDDDAAAVAVQKLDSFGIPVDIVHSRREKAPHDVWDFIHDLFTPVTRRGQKGKVAEKRNICLLCVQNANSNRRHTANTWKQGLWSTSATTNVLSHFRHNHKDHDIAVAAEAAVTSIAMGKIARSNTN